MSEVNIELEVIKAEIAKLESELRDAKARAKALKPADKSKAEPKLCACSCGEMTNGGTWLPGLDARFRSAMLTRIDNGDESAIDELMARPTLLHGATEAELRERLGSETRRKEAQVEREAERQAAKTDKPKAKVRPAPKPKTAKPRVDKVEEMQGTRSPSVTRNAAAIKLAKQRVA